MQPTSAIDANEEFGPHKLRKYQSNVLIDGEPYGRRNATLLAGINSYGDPATARRAKVERLAVEYENRIVSILTAISARRAGRAVLQAIDREPCVLLIRPFFGASPDSPNARAVTEDAVAGTSKGRLLRDEDGAVKRPRERGTGAGSDARVEFMPSDFAHHAGDRNANPGAMEDEAMLHELVHALRSMAGRDVGRTVTGQPWYDTIEEFYAIVIANIYRSEAGRTGLRAHHQNFSMMLFESDEFLKVERNRAHLRQLRRQQPRLFSDLHEVTAKFNPIRLMRD